MGEQVACPVCTLYLHAGMNLTEHLDTHPKEQVIKALVNLAANPLQKKLIEPFVSTEASAPSPTSSATPLHSPEESTKSVCEQNSNEQQPQHTGRTQIQQPPSGQSQIQPPTSLLFVNRQNNPFVYPGNELQNVGSGNLKSHNQMTNSSFGLPVANRQIHQGGSNKSIFGIPMQLFSQSHPKPLQPPPAYGAAISQLRSQNSQNHFNNQQQHYMNANLGRPQFQNNSNITISPIVPPPPPPPPHPIRLISATMYSSNVAINSNAINSRKQTHHTPQQNAFDFASAMNFNQHKPPLSGSRSLTSSPRQLHSPRPSPSPSVLRYADSPVTAQFFERENGDFLVQESPQHIVECVEKDNGEFAVIEKVVQRPPSVVQIPEGDQEQPQTFNEDHFDQTIEESSVDEQFNKTDETKRDEEKDSQKQSPSQKSAITVLSDVHLNVNEYVDLGNLIVKKTLDLEKSKTELIKIEEFDESGLIEKDVVRNDDKMDSKTSESGPQVTSAATSVIRMAPTPKPSAAPSVLSDEVMPESSSTSTSEKSEPNVTVAPSSLPNKKVFTKRGPKKLVIKPKTKPSTSRSDTSMSSTSAGKTECENRKIEKTEKLVPPPTAREASPISAGSSTSSSSSSSSNQEPQEEIVMNFKLEQCEAKIETSADENLSNLKTDVVVEEEMIQENIFPSTSYLHDEEKTILMEMSVDCYSYMSALSCTENTSLQANNSSTSTSSENSPTATTTTTTDSTQNETERRNSEFSALLQSCMKREEKSDLIDDSKQPKAIESRETQTQATTFPSTSLFSKPSTSSSALRNDTISEMNPTPSGTNNYSDYPFSFLYSTAQNEKAHQSSVYQNDEQLFNNKFSGPMFQHTQIQCFDEEDKHSYLDLDACQRNSSSTHDGSMPLVDALNTIRTDEKMPAKGEISEQESNGDIENSWSQPLYNEMGCRFPNPYEPFLSRESWSVSHDEYFNTQNLSSSVDRKPSTKNFLADLSSPIDEKPIEVIASTSRSSSILIPIRKKKKTPKVETATSSTVVARKKSFECEHCKSVFPKLKERNSHLIAVHGYTRHNRRLVRSLPSRTPSTPTATVTTNSLELEGIDGGADSKSSIVKIEVDPTAICKVETTQMEIETKPDINKVPVPVFRTKKYDSIRAGVYRILMNYNLSALKEKRDIEDDKQLVDSKSFCCYTCKQDFVTVKCFDEHLATHPAECFTCGKKFSRWTYFSIHLKRHIGWKDFACTICKKKFVIRSALVEHMRMHTGHTPIKCKLCHKSFKRYSNLTQHKKICHSTSARRKTEFVCYCGEVLPSKARYIWHKEIHDQKPKCCPCCRDRFVHANSLRRHIRLAHPDKFPYTQPMECPICNQVYAKASFKTHMATHSVSTQFDCHICNKSFSTKWNLKIHSWVHANRTAKPFKCDQCTKAFVREIDFKNHMNAHKKIKPYTCEYCGCKFIRKYNYMRHRREHHGEKKFPCDICGKPFHRHYYLVEHKRIHTGERPFLCTICGKSSTTKTNHNKHLKIHHSRDPFTTET